MKYTEPGAFVVDPMCGSGTTLIECVEMGRRGYGVDVNPKAVSIAQARVLPARDCVVELGDARDMRKVATSSADLVALHPPYLDIIRYSDSNPHDLSKIHELSPFLAEMSKIAGEVRRIVRPGGYVAILVGDLRRRRIYVPLAVRVMDLFLSEGFVLREDIIKVQWNCAGTQRWSERARLMNFHLIAHEHLFVFQRE